MSDQWSEWFSGGGDGNGEPLRSIEAGKSTPFRYDSYSVAAAIAYSRSEFRRTAGPNGMPPKAFRIHPDDWFRLLSESSRDEGHGMLDPTTWRFMGMAPLIDHRWPRHFPACLDAHAAAEAIEAGARPPRQ